jgi:hypothetical protein
VSGLQVVVDRHDREESRCRQLLAVHDVRRSVERFAAAGAAIQDAGMALTRTELVGELHELIAALDRRVPRVERAGEAAIAGDAAALRVKALKRIGELEGEESGDRNRLRSS